MVCDNDGSSPELVLPAPRSARSFSSLDAILVGVAANSEEAFHVFYNLTKKKVVKTCLAICRDSAVAEDLTSEVYGIVWQKASHWDGQRGSVIAWLCAIARNRSIDWVRRQSRVRFTQIDEAADIADDSPTIEYILCHYDEISAAMEALEKLPTDQKNAIHAVFLEQRPTGVIAAETGIPLGTVKSWVRRGLMDIRRQIQKGDELLKVS